MWVLVTSLLAMLPNRCQNRNHVRKTTFTGRNGQKADKFQLINKLSNAAKAGIASENIQAIRGMRNRIVHDYAGLDSFVVYNTIKNDLDPLKETFVKIIREGLANKSFDEGEFEAAKNACFYKFIDFSVI